MDLLVGALLSGVAQIAVPYVVNNIGRVKRPKRVNIEEALREAHLCRPVIPYRAPVPYTGGRVKALFIGINYTATRSQLSGCVNDAKQMLATLQRIQFPISECCILVDDPRFPNFTALPTRKNIIRHMAWLVYDVRPGDVLFFHYSGHGTETKAERDSEEMYDQCLVPLDYESQGAIVDDDLFDLLVRRLPAGVRMTAVFDCCHSASLLDLPFAFVGNNNYLSGGRHEMRKVRGNNFSHGDVVMFSGCDDAGTSADVANTSSFGAGSVAAGGAATQALTWALLNTSRLTYADIFIKTREMLRQKGYKQVPQLSSSKPVDLYKTFSLFGEITTNSSLMHYVPQQYQHPWVPPQQPYYPPPPPQQQPYYPQSQQPYYPPPPPPQQQQSSYYPQQAPSQYGGSQSMAGIPLMQASSGRPPEHYPQALPGGQGGGPPPQYPPSQYPQYSSSQYLGKVGKPL
ncbi:putative metacaspase 5 [Trypanosoma conorhini]|uniref:Putative metacaspase 5 n=1 Tax=Trypanosoma conorhini TaxID=83891 RepID=A0A3R7LXN0_9TRYP|nr:putative metacaspase 5 [Trypanosoma conorhini]RNF05351.1 putative metacaspase 5 [Trypanosoma conorhini]